MGIDNTNPVGKSYAVPAGRNFGHTYSTDQFIGLTEAGEPALERRNYDNPSFLWPKKSYMDISGQIHDVQRGYMRSLVTDPAVSKSTEVKNRRLFFQFNPQVLVRSVQQTVGAMNPLLQDPAQLVQPVPGTSSFGFTLFFNREHEVNSGYNQPLTDWLQLPNNSEALVSEIGVLADIMVLDSITGQGLSQDMLETLKGYTKKQYANDAAAKKAAEAQFRKNNPDASEDELAAYQPFDTPADDVIAKAFTANFGNQAFLNPLPFRVLFSSLFMVEGVATSVEVQFQKFSRTMVPTQCAVTINMYALYLGFAKKNTFLYDNLLTSATEGVVDKITDDALTEELNKALKKITLLGFTMSEANAVYNGVNIAVDRTERFKDMIDQKITNECMTFTMYYFLSETNDFQVDDGVISQKSVSFTKDGDANIPFSYIFSQDVVRLGCKELQDVAKKALEGSNDYQYITYRFVAKVTATSPTGAPIESSPLMFEPVYNFPWPQSFVGTTGPTQTWVQPPQVTTPRQNPMR